MAATSKANAPKCPPPEHMSSVAENKRAVENSTESFREKIVRKCGESVEMKEKFFSMYAEQIEAMSRDMAERFRAGRKLLVMGNGGSLCDALHFCVEFTHPIIEKRKAFPVIPLMTDICTMTAIGNDLDYSRIFVNQLELLGQPGDIGVGQLEQAGAVARGLRRGRRRHQRAGQHRAREGYRLPSRHRNSLPFIGGAAAALAHVMPQAR